MLQHPTHTTRFAKAACAVHVNQAQVCMHPRLPHARPQAGGSASAGARSSWLRTAEADMLPCMGSKDCMLDILAMHQAGGGTNAAVECRMLDYAVSLDRAAAFCDWITTTAGTVGTANGSNACGGTSPSMGAGVGAGTGAEAASEGMLVMLFDAQGKASDVWLFGDLPIAMSKDGSA